MYRRYGLLGTLALGLGLAACSTSANNATSNNPLAGVTIIQSTPTPVATATPIPTATPTPVPNAVEALNDTGFESGAFSSTAWTACSIPHAVPSPSPGSSATPFPVVPSASIGAAIVSPSSSPFQVAATPAAATTPTVNSGTFAALTYSGTGAQTTYTNMGAKTGPAGANGVCQTFTVPTSGVLSMYVNEGGSDTGLQYADQEADIISSSGTSTNLFYELNDPNYAGTNGATAGGTWVQKGPYNLTAAPYNLTVGQSYTLFAGSFDSDPGAKYGVYMFVDDVTLTGTAPASKARNAAPAFKLRPTRP